MNKLVDLDTIANKIELATKKVNLIVEELTMNYCYPDPPKAALSLVGQLETDKNARNVFDWIGSYDAIQTKLDIVFDYMIEMKELSAGLVKLSAEVFHESAKTA